MNNPFVGMSKLSLQTLLLSRLALLSNFRKECRYYKERLLSARDEQRRARLEIAQIEFALEQRKVVLFPVVQALEDAPPILEHRVFGRWGRVTFEPINPQNPEVMPKSNAG